MGAFTELTVALICVLGGLDSFDLPPFFYVVNEVLIVASMFACLTIQSFEQSHDS
jgi:hypothetical protein